MPIPDPLDESNPTCGRDCSGLGGEPSVFCPNIKMDKDNHVLINSYLQSRNPELNAIGQLMAEGLVIPSSQGGENYSSDFKTFKVFTKRQNKSFLKTSQELNTIIGEIIRTKFNKGVKLKKPDLELRIEIIDNMALIGTQKVQGYGGLPVGTSEKALSLISSGIDSPVASFKMLKRGVQLSYIHFHSFPATSDDSIKNVKEIIIELSKFQSNTKLFLVPFLDIQKKIMNSSPNKYWIILFRRAMMQVASDIAKENNLKVLITGENVGQVASQTLSNISVISDASQRPILRPLIGYNKKDIINLASEIGTYSISILPYEDCCSFFVPKHPETKAKLDIIEEIEKDITLDFDNLYNSIKKITIIGE